MHQFIATADVHAHNYAQFATPDATYGNSRLGDVIRCLYQMRAEALERGIADLVVVGDLFHTRGMLSVSVMNEVRKVLRSIVDSGIKVHLLAGNHDQANKAGTMTSIHQFHDFCNVYEDFTVYDKNCAFVPFRENKQDIIDMFNEAAKRKVDYVFAHCGVIGATIGTAEYQPAEEVSVADLKPERFKKVLLGHYHKMQYLAKNMFYLGNLCQTCFSDAGLEKGFWLIDGDSESVVDTVAPKFIVQELSDKAGLAKFLKTFDPTNFYKLRLTNGVTIPGELPNVVTENIEAAETYKPRIQNMDKLPVADVLAAYVDYRGGDKDSLLGYGNAAVQKVLKGVDNDESK